MTPRPTRTIRSDIYSISSRILCIEEFDRDGKLASRLPILKQTLKELKAELVEAQKAEAKMLEEMFADYVSDFA